MYRGTYPLRLVSTVGYSRFATFDENVRFGNCQLKWLLQRRKLTKNNEVLVRCSVAVQNNGHLGGMGWSPGIPANHNINSPLTLISKWELY